MTLKKHLVDEQKNWLLKSSTRILGPYTYAEIADMLKKKHVSLIDEVRRPSIRWMTIRENKTFMETVRYMQEIDMALEGTQSQKTTTASVSRTENIYDIEDQNDIESTQVEYNRPAVNREILSSPLNLNQNSNIKDISPVKETNLQRHPSYSESKSFGVADDKRRAVNFEKKYNALKKIIIGLIVAAILAFAGQILFQKEKADQLFNNLIASALRYKALNLYDKSIESYRKAKAIKKVDSATANKMASLVALYDSDASGQRQILTLQTQGDEAKNRKQVVESLVSLGILSIRDSDFNQAKDFFQKALSYDSSSEPALINKAFVLLKEKKSEEAIQTLGKLSSSNFYSAVGLYAKALALLQISQKKSIVEEVKSINIDIENQLQRSSYMQNYLRLIDLRLQLTLQDKANVERSVEKFLQLEPGFINDQIKFYQLDWSYFDSESYLKLCQEVSRQIPSGVLTQALSAFCSIETERFAEAQKYINEALAVSPSSPYALHVQAFALSKMQKYSETAALIRKHQNNLFPTTLSLLGRACIELRDESCVTQSLNEAKNKMVSQSQSYFGLASWLAKNGKSIEALPLIKSGLETNSEYRPLVELRSQLESME